MKPLPSAPLTDEDWTILVNHRGDFRRAYLMGWLLGHGRESDRRDAALMLWAQGFTLGTEFAGRRVRQYPRITPVRVTLAELADWVGTL
jgi:hypothetical protein